MAYSEGTITNAPVNQYDIQRALGTNECDIGSLCRHANINPWAKFKPNRYGGKDTTKSGSTVWLDSSTGQWTSVCTSIASSPYAVSSWWRNYQIGSDCIYSCGFMIPKCSFSDLSANGFGAWEYQKPRGLSYNEPYRELDFTQYRHDARCPFSIQIPSQIIANSSGSNNLVKLMFPTARANELSLDDIFKDGQGHRRIFGVAAFIGNSVYIKTQQDYSAASISLESLPGATAGVTFTIVAFMTTEDKICQNWTATTQQMTGFAYSLDAPNIEFPTVVECKVVAQAEPKFRFVINGFQLPERIKMGGATYNYNTWRISGTAKIVVINSGSSYTLKTVTMILEKVNEDGSTTLESEASYLIPEQNTQALCPICPANIRYMEYGGGPYTNENAFNVTNPFGLPTLENPLEYWQVTAVYYYEYTGSGNR